MSVEHDATVAADATVTDAGRGREIAGAGMRTGAMLAHFRIDGLLGKGGMGEVYRATDLALDRPVALKVLPAAVAQDPGRRERLFREARAQARLQHPNVCHIYYVGQQDGVVFFAMELVAGETVAARLARGPVPPEQAIEIVRQAAMGLREAARHGFTHRDVKPSNLMVDGEGRVKVVDFGLVSRGEESGHGHGHGHGGGETGVVGTPLYMAPEQAAGEEIDVRADIYALGATLHHLVSGRPPFEGDSVDALATLHRQEPRPRLAAPGRRTRALSAIDQVIARMMAKRREDRFADHDELIAELDRVSPARTRPAGLWARGIATMIDLMAMLLAIAPAQVIAQWMDREIPDDLVFLVIAPLYGIIAWSRWGTTIGRWLLDLEVTTVPGLRRPSLGAAALRYLVEFGPLSLAVVVGLFVEGFVPGLLGVASIAWGVGGLTYAALLAPDKRAPWDRVAGTMVRYRAR